MKSCSKAALAGLALFAAPAPALAAAVVAGFDGTSLARGDDFSVGPVSLGFTANYFGNNYSQTFVSSNGYITFGAGQSAFTPVGLGAGYAGLPIIAPFFADIDTRNLSSGLIGYGTGSFGGRNAFGVTFNDVGYYFQSSDKLNDFQLLLVDRSDIGAGDFDIVFNYDSIQWESGDVESPTDNGLGGNSASVGYNAGSGNAPGTFFAFPGSQTPGSFLDGGPLALAQNSNIGVTGRYLFTVRNGIVDPGSAIPEPATWAMLIVGFGVVGTAMRRNRKRVSVSFV